jgi:hypothetical protein
VCVCGSDSDFYLCGVGWGVFGILSICQGIDNKYSYI